MLKKAALSSIVIASLCIPAFAKDASHSQSTTPWFHYSTAGYNSPNSSPAQKTSSSGKPAANVQNNKDFSKQSSEKLANESTSLELSARKGLYLSLSAGASAPFDLSSSSGILGPGAGHISYGTGPTASGAIGVYLGDFRAEVESSYFSSDMEGISVMPPHISLGGNFNSLSFMGNLYYDFHLTPTLDFYIGGGAGAAHENFSMNFLTKFSDDDWVFAYQGRAGFSLQISKGAYLTLGYRYWRSFDPTFNLSSSIPIPAGSIKLDSPEVHQAMIGLRIDL